MKVEYILSEYSERLIQYELTNDERKYLQEISCIHKNTPWEQRFYFDELRTGLRIKTTSYVGVIELENIRIIIQPKFDEQFDNVIDMLLFAKGHALWKQVNTTGTVHKNNLFLKFIELFVSEAEDLLQNALKKDYVSKEENLKNVSGRILIRENAMRNFNLPTSVYCQYDELIYDVLENQVILTVLEMLAKLNIGDFKQQILHLRQQFEMICKPFNGNRWPNFTYNRLNEMYRLVHILGKYLFERLFLQNHRQQHSTFQFSFLLDMNELFELFVFQLLNQYCPVSFSVQHGKRLTDAFLLDGQRYRDIIPDLLVTNRNSGETYVLDTKYKGYDLKRVSTNDLYQLSIYAQYFQRAESYKATIIYPVFNGVNETTERYIEINRKAKMNGKIALRSISIELVLKWIAQRKNDELRILIKQLVGIAI